MPPRGRSPAGISRADLDGLVAAARALEVQLVIFLLGLMEGNAGNSSDVASDEIVRCVLEAINPEVMMDSLEGHGAIVSALEKRLRERAQAKAPLSVLKSAALCLPRLLGRAVTSAKSAKTPAAMTLEGSAAGGGGGAALSSALEGAQLERAKGDKSSSTKEADEAELAEELETRCRCAYLPDHLVLLL
jgi:hypothetical protein